MQIYKLPQFVNQVYQYVQIMQNFEIFLCELWG
jgi:hypothetical protein